LRASVVALLVLLAPLARADATKEACIAADTHAQELRRTGKLREALSTLESCTNESCPSIVRADCSDRVTEIRAAMPTVVFDVNVAETHVDLDGHPLLDRVDAHPIDVDPGDHTFVLSAKGAHETVRFTLSEGEKGHRVTWVVPEPPVRRIPPSPTPRILGLTSVALGVAGIAVGSIFGALTIADHSTVTSECPNDVCPSRDILLRANATNDESRTFGLASNVAFIAGAVFVAIGVVLYATAPRRARIVVGFNGLSGSF
jgi:hypothetical protein